MVVLSLLPTAVPALGREGPTLPARLVTAREEGPDSRADVGADAGSAGTPTLWVGTYIRAIDAIDLNNNSFEADFDLWTLWNGAPDENPSADLALLNDIYNGDLYRFDFVTSKRSDGRTWNLYTVHSRFIHRWRLAAYPFDRHALLIRVGWQDRFRNDIQLRADKVNSGLSPALYLPGWSLYDRGTASTSSSSLTTLGDPSINSLSQARDQSIFTSMELVRKAHLHLVPDFLGYILAVGLCMLALVISRSRDDLILAAVVSAAGNYVFLAGMLPVAAMSGFIGKLQFIILLGILYVVGADEIIDHHLGAVAPRWSNLLRYGVLPSYLLMTMLAIYLIIPGGVVEVG
jgi:hypothetical protein